MLSEFVEMVHRTESMSYFVLRARDDGSVDIVFGCGCGFRKGHPFGQHGRERRRQGASGAITFQVQQHDVVAPAYSGTIKISTSISVTAQASLQLTAAKGESSHV